MNILKRIFSKKQEQPSCCQKTNAEEKRPPKKETLKYCTYQYSFYMEDRVFKVEIGDDMYSTCRNLLTYAEKLERMIQRGIIEIDQDTFIPVSSVKLIKRKLKKIE